MRDHALPQDVTGYKFHIIGNMTLKQFGEVAAGCIAGFFVYQTNLAAPIKWGLIVTLAGFGAMVAFVPIEERPLDQWIISFFRALYRPTQYYWKRKPKIPEPFLYEPKVSTKSLVGEVDLTPARRNRVKEYLRSIEQEEAPDAFEADTAARMENVMSIFGTQTQVAPQSFGHALPSAEMVAEPLAFAGRASGEETSISATASVVEQDQAASDSQTVIELFNSGTAPATVPTPQISTVFAAAPPELVPTVSLTPLPSKQSSTNTVAQITELTESGDTQLRDLKKNGVTKIEIKSAQNLSQPQNDVALPHIIDMTQVDAQSQPAAAVAPPANETAPKKGVVQVPNLSEVKVNNTVISPTEAALAIDSSVNPEMRSAVDPSLLDSVAPQKRVEGLQSVTFNPNLPFPDKITVPNKVVGMVFDHKGAAVPEAIVEILTQSGMPARAVKTKSTGQFFITTPLNKGEYIVKTEKDQLKFADLQLVIDNTVLSPLEIRAMG